jgi:hypothetical protein
MPSQVVTTVNAFSILAPWMAGLGAVACVGVAFVVAKKHEK